jgi:hypothetical protein
MAPVKNAEKSLKKRRKYPIDNPLPLPKLGAGFNRLTDQTGVE